MGFYKVYPEVQFQGEAEEIFDWHKGYINSPAVTPQRDAPIYWRSLIVVNALAIWGCPWHSLPPITGVQNT